MNTTDMTSASLLAELIPRSNGETIYNTYGAVLLGTFFTLMMYGLLLHQTYNYFRIHSADSLWIKRYVVFILLLDTAQLVMSAALCYLKLITHYSDVSYQPPSDWPVTLQGVMSAADIVACQGFFAYRVYKINKTFRPVVYFCMVCQLGVFGMPLAFAVEVFRSQGLRSYVDLVALIAVPPGLTVLVDTILALVLVVYLHRSRTGLKSTETLVDKLIAYAVTTGLLTAVFNILSFIFALINANNLYFAALNMIATRVYTCSVMAALNFRKPRRQVHGQWSTMALAEMATDNISFPEMPHFVHSTHGANEKGGSIVATSSFPGDIRNLNIKKDVNGIIHSAEGGRSNLRSTATAPRRSSI